MGTVFQHLPKISEETIYSITLFKKSNKISKMKAFILCCALFFIGCVNGAPWGSGTSVMKRSDALRNDHHHHGHHKQREGNLVQEDIGQEHLANRAGPQEREVVVPRFESDESRQFLGRDDEPRQIGVPKTGVIVFDGHALKEALKKKLALKRKNGDEPKKNVGEDEANRQYWK